MFSGIRLPSMLMNNMKLQMRNSTRGVDNCENKKNIMFTIRKLAFEWSGHNKYGLYTHDIIDYDKPVVREALRRLPKDVLDARNFRLIRALQLNFVKIYLPKEQWITFEQDIRYRYLSPYMEEIMAEQAEIHEFGCLNYSDTDWPADEVK